MDNFVCCYESSCTHSNFDDCGFGYNNDCNYRCDECENQNTYNCQSCDHRDYNLGYCNSED